MIVSEMFIREECHTTRIGDYLICHTLYIRQFNLSVSNKDQHLLEILDSLKYNTNNKIVDNVEECAGYNRVTSGKTNQRHVCANRWHTVGRIHG